MLLSENHKGAIITLTWYGLSPSAIAARLGVNEQLVTDYRNSPIGRILLDLFADAQRRAMVESVKCS